MATPSKENAQVTKTGTDPAAGAEISDTVPAGKIWILRGVSVSFVASAVAGNRRVNLICDDGATVVFQERANADIIVSETRTVRGIVFGSTRPLDTTTLLFLSIPSTGITLPAGSRIRTSTDGILGGDNYGAPTYIVEEYNIT